MIKERLFTETENNIGITVKESEERSEAYDVMGRGELQLGRNLCAQPVAFLVLCLRSGTLLILIREFRV